MSFQPPQLVAQLPFEKHGAESFIFPDSAQSVSYSSGTSSTNGDGYSNNAVFSSSFTVSAAPGGATIPNDGFVSRLLSNPPTAGADFSSSWPSSGTAAASTTIANQSSRGAFVASAATANAVMGTWNYILKIKLTDLRPIFKELDLMANPQIRLRFRVNQGTSMIAVDSGKGMSLTSTTLSSGSVCPVMVSASSTGNPMAGVLAASAGFSIAWGAVVNSLEPTIDGTYMPFTTARLYVPFHNLENPQAIISKPVKKVRYLDTYAQWFYQRAGTGKNSGLQHNVAFDLQLSASVKNAKYVAVMPFAEQTNNFATASVQQFQSPFDSAPWTVQPGSTIRNFNVRIGSSNVFAISHDYDFATFVDNFAKLGAINGDLTPEITNGLIDYQTWSLTNRVLVADVSRLTEKDVPQAIQISGTNAGCQGCNLLYPSRSYDRLTGEVLEWSTATLTFGKHKSKTIQEVFTSDPGYCRWLSNQKNLLEDSSEIGKFLTEKFGNDDGSFLMTWGKYKLKTIKQIQAVDTKYLEWLSKNEFVQTKMLKLKAEVDELLK
ncbi:hypothetical protein P3T76_009745 [Phytophthora citrophthora]|uniref:Exodeoxyribonuclease X-like C-terminal domain-containing protein n=1 Tax=Phytophthora citrophthora TaxID=4793 RepID=A0AAD9LIL0_9STRA|nr:hypothetical protein P3T76_009745 [Phytophthora citrophthora]